MACLTPFKTNDGQLVPCGKCPDCRGRRISGWSFRLMEEEKRCSSAFFLTLTYDPMKVPMSPRGFMTLDSSIDQETGEIHHMKIKKKDGTTGYVRETKRDLQLFFKSLRKANSLRKIKYYAVGEYGGKTKRPHYHIILFNADITTVQNAWTKGQIHYGNVSGASVGYTLKYMSKPKTVPKHKNDDRLPEFSIMSKDWVRLTYQKKSYAGTKQTSKTECT